MSENWKLQVSPKLPDGTLVNLRAESGQEMSAMLNWLTQNAQDVTTTAALLTGASNAAGAGLTRPPAPQQGPPPDWAQPQQQPPAWGAGAPANAPTCQHGARKYVTGTGARGPWAAWMCPTPKGTPGQCEPEWVK